MSLFPLRRPEVLLAMCRSVEAELLAIGPDLLEPQIDRLLYELSLVRQAVYGIGEQIRNSLPYDARQRLPLVEQPRKPPKPWPRPGPCFPDQGTPWYRQRKVAG